MPLGMIVLFILAALVYFGIAQRVLDRMRLTDGQAFAFLALMFVGGFIDVPLTGGSTAISVNVGGALVPLALVIYLLSRAGTAKERIRSLLATVATAATIWLIGSLTDFDPLRGRMMILDPLWLYSLVGGVMGYIAGRSRRGAFIAGVLGVLLVDIVHAINVSAGAFRSTVAIGGAGIYDAVILAGVVAVTFAEVFGEVRERIHSGSESADTTSTGPDPVEGVEEGDPDA